MRAIAVNPMANPVRSRRSNSPGNICRNVEPGCCRRTVKLHAEIMNNPRLAISIRYSGQCFVNVAIASVAARAGAARFGITPFTNSSLTVDCIAHRIRRSVSGDNYFRQVQWLVVVSAWCHLSDTFESNEYWRTQSTAEASTGRVPGRRCYGN